MSWLAEFDANGPTWLSAAEVNYRRESARLLVEATCAKRTCDTNAQWRDGLPRLRELLNLQMQCQYALEKELESALARAESESATTRLRALQKLNRRHFEQLRTQYRSLVSYE